MSSETMTACIERLLIEAATTEAVITGGADEGI